MTIVGGGVVTLAVILQTTARTKRDEGAVTVATP
jgi:hypothetical protein